MQKTAENTAPQDDSLFDTRFIQMRKQRADKQNASSHFLIDWALKDILDRLALIKRDFKSVLIHGDFFDKTLLNVPQIGSFIHLGNSQSCDIICTSELLPLKAKSFDLVISLFEMQRLNDPVGYLHQMHYALKADGLFMGAYPGEQSFQELAIAMAQAEIDIKGGQSPRTLPLMNRQDAGACLQRAHFTMPVVDMDGPDLSYRALKTLFQDIRAAGGGNTLTQRSRAYVGRDLFVRVEDIYKDRFLDENGHYKVTTNILFLSGWTPHQNQQKPLRPGTAQNSMTEALS